ncbi:CdvA-like protein [Desulfurococcaceae archaeon MEX13E-LK6-19]|nr:CdvA-like protein [Desulfurococcaceae archaeon MEX13E-LK6-19]
MGISINFVEKYLGKHVKDPYGRILGTLISFFSDADGNVDAVEVCLGEKNYLQVPIEQVRFVQDSIILIPDWQFEAEKIVKRLEILRKRLYALEDLYAKKEIPRHSYELFKKKLEDEFVKAKEDAKKVKEMLRKKVAELEDTIVELDKAFTSVKMSYIAGEISDKTYKAVADQIRKYLEYAIHEKEDVKRFIDKMEGLETQPLPIQTVNTEEEEEEKDNIPSQEQPMPVVVIDST